MFCRSEEWNFGEQCESCSWIVGTKIVERRRGKLIRKKPNLSFYCLQLEGWASNFVLLVNISAASKHHKIQGSLNYPVGGMKQCKCMVILKDMSLIIVPLFGLVIE